MARALSLLVVGLFALALFSGVPDAEGAHQWGHRFMIFGRVLDADGEPAQGLQVTLSIQSNQEPHPQMTVTTDCSGLYYAQQDQQRPGDHRTELGRLHIHNHEYASSPEFFVATPYADYREDALTPGAPLSEEQLREYAIHVGDADEDLQSAHANIQLEESLDPREACADAGDWRNTYAVRGKVQVDEGGSRQDQVGPADPGEVTVTLRTSEGRVTESQTPNEAGEYVVVFDNVTVTSGDQITAEWNGNERSRNVDTTFHATTINIVDRDWFWESTGFQVFIGIVLVIVVVGLGAWGFTRAKDRAETKKAMERSTRKRANK